MAPTSLAKNTLSCYVNCLIDSQQQAASCDCDSAPSPPPDRGKFAIVRFQAQRTVRAQIMDVSAIPEPHSSLHSYLRIHRISVDIIQQMSTIPGLFVH